MAQVESSTPGRSLLSSTTVPDLTDKITRLDDQYCAAGGFADVFRCRYTSDDGVKEVAVKAFRFSFSVDENKHDKGKAASMIRRELGIWKRLNHPNIVPFLGIAHGFGRQGNAALVSMWMPHGTLHTFLETHSDRLAIVDRLQLLLDIANGLDHLHSFPMVHGDLSSNNVLLDHNHNARLTDFGCASLVGELPEGFTYLKTSTVRGTLRWAAPEHVLSSEDETKHTVKSDIYSFGNMGLLVLSGRHPWCEVRTDAAVLLQLFQGHKPARPLEPPIEDCHWALVERCWSSISDRPLAKDLTLSLQQFVTAAKMPGAVGLLKSIECANNSDTELQPSTPRALQPSGSISILSPPPALSTTSRPPSRKPSVDLGQGGAPEPQQKLQLLPRTRPTPTEETPPPTSEDEPEGLTGSISERLTTSLPLRPTTPTVATPRRMFMRRSRFEPHPEDSVILVMGLIGSGKSNFINSITGNTEQRKAGNLRSDTQSVTPCRIMYQGLRLVLVDMPSFGDNYRQDSETLKTIACWLIQKYPDGTTLKIAGIIYLHRITDNRMSVSAYENLQIFGRLCGDIPLPRTRLVTTMWDLVKDSAVATQREAQLKREFWQVLLEQGATAHRFDNTLRSAQQIVGSLLSMEGKSDLLLQEELVEQQKHLNETEAGKVIYNQLQQLLAVQKMALKELAEEAKLKNDPDLARGLQIEYQKIDQQLQKAREEMKEMKIPLSRRILSWSFGRKSRAKAIELA